MDSLASTSAIRAAPPTNSHLFDAFAAMYRNFHEKVGALSESTSVNSWPSKGDAGSAVPMSAAVPPAGTTPVEGLTAR